MNDDLNEYIEPHGVGNRLDVRSADKAGSLFGSVLDLDAECKVSYIDWDIEIRHSACDSEQNGNGHSN